MTPDPYADMFRFRLGDAVRYAEQPDQRFVIGQRRWTERTILSPVVEYKLKYGLHQGVWVSWVPDADLMPWAEGDGEASQR